MPAIEIRPATANDIPSLVSIDHHYTSDHVWQMDLQVDEGQVGMHFRKTRLPRPVRVEYPRPPEELVDTWTQRSGLLVAVYQSEPVAYISMMQSVIPLTTLVVDLTVHERLRRQGIGSALVLAALEWASAQSGTRRLILEFQPKNFPAISLAQKLGFDFCGYTDHYFENQDIALFFSKWLR